MRSRTQLYDSLLKYQVELSYGTETSMLKQSRWLHAKSVLDYGCGNAFFSYCLSKENPDKVFYCCDCDKDILSIANQTSQMHLIRGSYPSVDIPNNIDFFIVRHLTSYLSDRKTFFKWIKEHASPTASILLIDAYDDDLIIEPYMPHFQHGLDSFYDKVNEDGGQRDIFADIRSELAEVGFICKNERKIVINSAEMIKKEKLFVYMNLVAELDNGLPLSEKIREELMQWITNPKSFLQYGLFACVYELT